ncbi:MAG: rhodanese-like domain-containing protein [Tepidisphaeraceae bacterium]|jgi:rhodanese-related sulfurtransferase
MATTVPSFATAFPTQVYELQKQGRNIDLIDVRTDVEYGLLHAVGARSIPLGQLTPASAVAERCGAPEDPIYIICQSGARSRRACQRLAAAGVNVVNVEGGTTAWRRGGLPVVGATNTIPRVPTRLRLGGVLLAAVLLILGATVHPLFLWLALALWLALLVVNRGCPLGACGVPRHNSQTADRDKAQIP